MSRSRGGERLLNLLTVAVAVTALVIVWIDRIQPSLSKDGAAKLGTEVGSRLALVTVPGGAPVAGERLGSALLLVYQSTCPVCERVAPEWAEFVRLAPDRVFALGLEEDATAAAWVSSRLPGAVHVRPAERQSFLETLGIRAVPATFLVEGGRLVLDRIGPLGPADVTRIREVLAPATRP